MSTLTTAAAEPRYEHPCICPHCRDTAVMVIESYKLDQKNDLEIVIDADCMNCGSAYHHRLPFDLRCQLVNDGSPIRDLYGAMFVHCGKPMTLGAGGAGRDYAELTCNCGYRNDVYFQ